MSKVYIFFIYAENCNHCDQALLNIETAVKKCSKIACEIMKFRYDTPSAVQIAVNKGIDDLPGIVIGDKVFMKECGVENVIDAIKKASKK